MLRFIPVNAARDGDVSLPLGRDERYTEVLPLGATTNHEHGGQHPGRGGPHSPYCILSR
jgi:hypothetical protein